MKYKKNTESINNSGYVQIHDPKTGKLIVKHRKIWEENNGIIPLGGVIHHINNDRQDNRIENLQLIMRNVRTLSRREKNRGRINSNGHIQIYDKMMHQWVLEHRKVWEDTNGPIPKGMKIHHINGIKTDNRIENLQLVSQNAHMKIHAGYKFINSEWWKYCRKCGELKKVNTDFTTDGSGIARYKCKKCVSKYNKQYKQIKLLVNGVKNAIQLKRFVGE